MATPNSLVRDTASPPIPQVQAWGRAYDGHRGNLIDLCQAVPGYPPPPAMLERLAGAAGRPEAAKYGLILGDEALREAYAAHLSAFYDGQIGADQVAITAGCNQAFFAAILTLVERGGRVMLPTPVVLQPQDDLRHAGPADAGPALHSPSAASCPIPEEAERLLDTSVRAIVLVTPNNPTGAIYPPQTIAKFHALCQRRGLWLILDETYRDFLPPDRAAPHGLMGDKAWPDHLVQLYSFSKAYAMPGHRVGALAAAASLDAAADQSAGLRPYLPATAGAVRPGLGAGHADGVASGQPAGK